MRHQLLALQVLADVETAALARSAWHGLTRAMHHHTYELAPTAAELHGWRQEVTDLRYLLAQRRSSSEFVAESQSVSRELVQRYEAETTHEDSQTEAHLRDI